MENEILELGTGDFFAWACATAEQPICMRAHHRFCLHQNGASRNSIIKIILLVGLGECARDLTNCEPWIPEDIFLLIDTDGSRWGGVNEARSAEERELSISTGLFHLRYFEDRPPEPGCKMCSLQKKKITWSPQKQSRPALTYHELLSNFIIPFDLDNSARICSAWRIALTSSKYKQSAERL